MFFVSYSVAVPVPTKLSQSLLRSRHKPRCTGVSVFFFAFVSLVDPSVRIGFKFHQLSVFQHRYLLG